MRLVKRIRSIISWIFLVGTIRVLRNPKLFLIISEHGSRIQPHWERVFRPAIGRPTFVSVAQWNASWAEAKSYRASRVFYCSTVKYSWCNRYSLFFLKTKDSARLRHQTRSALYNCYRLNMTNWWEKKRSVPSLRNSKCHWTLNG